MRLRVKDVKLSSGGVLVAILNGKDAKDLDVFALDRIRINKKITAVVNISEGNNIKTGEIGLFSELLRKLNVGSGDYVSINTEKKPESVWYIKNKLDGKRLNKREINAIVKDIVENDLTEAELGFFISGCYINGLNLEETGYLTNAIVENGTKLKFGNKIILDKHCIPADTPVIVRNSGNVKVENIGKTIDSIFNKCNKNDIYFDGGAYYTNKNLNYLHAMVHDDNGKIKFVPVSAVYRLKSPKHLIELKLIGNRTIKATDNHTIFTLKNGNIISTPIQKIKKEEYILVPTGFPSKNLNEITIKNDYGIRNYKPFSKKVKVTKELMRLLGYYISEGFTNNQGVFLNFGSHEKKLIKDSIKCFKRVFNINPTINKPHKTAIRVTVYNKTLSKIFKALKIGNRALNKKIPSFIFDVNNNMKIEFIRALIKGDGSIRRGYEASYASISKQLINDLQYLLSSVGLSCSLSEKKASSRIFEINGKEYFCKTRKAYIIYTQAREIGHGKRQNANVSYLNLLPLKELGEIDRSNIGWEFRRELKRNKFITKDKLAKIIDCIKSEDIKKLIKGNISVLSVKDIKRVKSRSKYVYDFRIKGYNRFIAGSAPICIHNSSGGTPGNRTSMIIVPILAAAGFTIPKTSSRAITSAAGTADVMEVLCRVSFSSKKIKEIVRKTNACIVWSGAMDIASADDKLIKIERLLSLDPEGILLASVLAKKKAVGSNHVLIDIPYGRGAKIETKKRAIKLRRKFIRLGRLLGMKIKVILTDGSQPVGNGIGPSLEARDVLEVLQGIGPEDLRKKGVYMAGLLLEMAGIKDGKKRAVEILESGKAYKKFKQIVKAQGGKIRDIEIAKYRCFVQADKRGIVEEIDNKLIAKIARVAGAPIDKKAGIYLRVKRGSKVEKGDCLFIIYSENKKKLEYAKEFIENVISIK